MRHLVRLSLVCILATAFSGLPRSAASAATRDGVTLPDTYPVDGRSLTLNGLGLRKKTIFGIRIYVAGLYLQQKSHDAQQILKLPGPKVLMLQFLHSGTKSQVEEQYREGEANNCGDGSCAASDQPDFERLVAAAPAVEVGDRSIFVFNDSRVRVYANNRLLVDFVNADLAYRLLAGFIGNHPPSQALRNGLLGLPDE